MKLRLVCKPLKNHIDNCITLWKSLHYLYGKHYNPVSSPPWSGFFPPLVPRHLGLKANENILIEKFIRDDDATGIEDMLKAKKVHPNGKTESLTTYASLSGGSAWDQRQGEPYLLRAAFNGSTNVVKVLLKYGCDVNIKDQVTGLTPIMPCVYQNHRDLFKYFLNVWTSPFLFLKLF